MHDCGHLHNGNEKTFLNKKIKLGIYGDSFATSGKIEKAWSTFLKIDDEYEVDIYSWPATSTEWSVLKFAETYHLYDKIIFVVTSPDRLYVNNHPTLQHWTATTHHQVDTIPQEQRLEYKNYIKFHTKYMMNSDVLNAKQKIYLDYIMAIKPETLLIPAFDNSIPQCDYIDLFSISCLDLINPKPEKYLRRLFDNNQGDTRPCHMNVINNHILYQKIKNWIQTNKFDLYNKEDFFIPESRQELFIKQRLSS